MLKIFLWPSFLFYTRDSDLSNYKKCFFVLLNRLTIYPLIPELYYQKRYWWISLLLTFWILLFRWIRIEMMRIHLVKYFGSESFFFTNSMCQNVLNLPKLPGTNFSVNFIKQLNYLDLTFLNIVIKLICFITCSSLLYI